MTVPPFPHAMSKLSVGNVTVKNRTVVTAHTYGLLDGTERGLRAMAEYVGARLDGGIGVVVLGETVARPEVDTGRADWGAAVSGDGLLPLYRELSQRAAQNGAVVIEQLYHPGGQVWHEEGSVAVAPSAVPHTRSYVLPRSATADDIGALVGGFAAAARRVALGGLTGVELKCDQGKLHHQFLSARYNLRNDGYGGSVVRRARFTRETLERVRAMAPGQVIGVRLPSGVDAPAVGGRCDLRTDEVAALVELLASDGLIDYVSFSIETNSTAWGYWQGHPDEHVGAVTGVPVLTAVCRAAGLPVVLAGSVTALDVADRMVACGVCDLVGMTRAHVADPQLVAKTIAGREHEVIPCTGCNQGCVGNTWYGKPIRCSVNPTTGRESVLTLRSGARSRGHVVVVGGGPAGLESAWRLGSNGFRVVLHEKLDELGGQWLAAAELPGRRRFARWLDYITGRLDALDIVQVVTGSEISVDSPEFASAVGVVVATGALTAVPSLLALSPGVVTAEQAIADSKGWSGASVLVIDGERHKDCLGVAELLGKRGARVHLVTPFDAVGLGLDPVTLASRMSRLITTSTAMTTWSEVVGFRYGVAEVYNQLTNEITALSGIDRVVFSVNGVPDVSFIRMIEQACAGCETPIRVVGDARSPRGFEVAVREGFDAAGELMEVLG